MLNKEFSLKLHLRMQFCLIPQVSKTNSDWISSPTLHQGVLEVLLNRS